MCCWPRERLLGSCWSSCSLENELGRHSKSWGGASLVRRVLAALSVAVPWLAAVAGLVSTSHSWGLHVALAEKPELAEVEGVPPEQVLARPSVYDSKWFPQDEESSDYAGSADRRFIYVHQDSQMMYIFQDGLIIRQIPMSTGLPTPRTHTKAWTGRVGVYWGTFFAHDVYADEAWFLFKDDGSILIHSAPYTLADDEKVYQDLDLLGVRPASHGCIRIPPEESTWLTSWGPNGTLTLITPLTASFEDE